ncbi:cyclin-domain-containing protein [Stereum hirsutum FP-91666 SS1]|uniref:cyclin-domain-containing protein n=1 Tax=Stereum hirsutum (strain FP-91666) TaxID=721885 RepID=UPI0004449907|nr:cyclin-domain-containing protein [Stereum hirsutum FP-91666 SS1]EIM81256.1 cyclin-domain-containing protein [Stereum hirsutum FP-91666 SS1]
MEAPAGVGLPPAFEDSDIDHLLELIALMLERLTSINDQIPLAPSSVTRFHSAAVPQISILDYLRRIVRYTNCEKTCILIVMHYIDQICARLPNFTISSLTCHRFIITAVALSSKTLCDAFCTNAHYARIGGISPIELTRLEREFLIAIDWRLTCTREILQLYYDNLVAHSNGRFYIIGSHPSQPEPQSPSESHTHSRSRAYSTSSMTSSGSSDISTSPPLSRSTSPISSMSMSVNVDSQAQLQTPSQDQQHDQAADALSALNPALPYVASPTSGHTMDVDTAAVPSFDPSSSS